MRYSIPATGIFKLHTFRMRNSLPQRCDVPVKSGCDYDHRRTDSFLA
jgi:hypothetical protein